MAKLFTSTSLLLGYSCPASTAHNGSCRQSLTPKLARVETAERSQPRHAKAVKFILVGLNLSGEEDPASS